MVPCHAVVVAQQVRLPAPCCPLRSISDVVSKAKAGHYQLACACAFEGINKVPCDTGVNHPNQYYEESIKTEGGGVPGGGMGWW